MFRVWGLGCILLEEVGIKLLGVSTLSSDHRGVGYRVLGIWEF